MYLIKKMIACCFLFAMISSCNNGMQQYEKIKKEELAKGTRSDSIFFGIYLGMTSKNFYMHCWDLNKKGMFTDGQNNTMVMYRLNKNELPHTATLNFYPDFFKNKIFNMRSTFQYDGWAPWNKNLYADSLVPRVLQLYNKWYGGNAFIEIDDKKRGTIYVKVDGNRRIIVGKSSDSKVNVEYTDLLAEQQMKK